MADTTTAQQSPQTTVCGDCEARIDVLDAFPGNRCLNCHATATANDPLPTARELARMFGAR